MAFEERYFFKTNMDLDITSIQLGSSITYAPAPKNQKDLTNRNIVGNLIFKHNYYNDVLSMPIYEKENNNYKIPIVYEKEGRFSKNDSDNFYIDNADFYFTLNTAHKGYEKLVNAIENNEKVEFSQNQNQLDDFSQLGEYSDYSYDNLYNSLVNNIEYYNEVFSQYREPEINDIEKMTVNNFDYEVKFNPETQHIYINNIPTHSVNEQYEIRVLNDNLSKDIEKDYFNKDYKFSYNDYKTLEDNSYTYIDLNEYTDSNNKFIKNLIEDIPPNELLVDSIKQRINYVDQQINFRDINVLKTDLTNFAEINNLTDLDEVNYLNNSYDDYLNVISTNLENNIENDGLKNRFMYLDEPFHLMKTTTNTLYDNIENDIRNISVLDRNNRSDLREVLTYLHDSKNNIGNLISKHETSKSSMISQNSLAILDNEKFKLTNQDFHTQKEQIKAESFYEGMKATTLPINQITPQEYNNRENDIEIISEFIKYAKSEVNNIDLKPDFINNKLYSNNNSIDFDSILIGSEEQHDIFLDNLKEESLKTKEKSLDI